MPIWELASRYEQELELEMRIKDVFLSANASTHV